MQNSPVLELQSLASSSTSDVQEVLLKAKMISVKLGLNDISEWLEFEINGYSERCLIPEYRIIKGVPIKAFNPLNGWIHVDITNIPDRESYDKLSTVHIADAISSLVEYSKEMRPLYIAIPKPKAEFLNQIIVDSQRFQLAWIISSVEANRIISTVKTKVLDWSLELEQRGIIGEGLLFSQKEKEVAHMTVNNTTNIHGNVNNSGVIGSGNDDITQTNTMKINIGDFNSLEAELKKLGISTEDLQELKQAIDETPKNTISRENLGGKIGNWVGNMVGKAYSGSLKVAKEVAPLLITNAICAYYGIPV